MFGFVRHDSASSQEHDNRSDESGVHDDRGDRERRKVDRTLLPQCAPHRSDDGSSCHTVACREYTSRQRTSLARAPMTWHWQIEEQPDHLLVRVEGEWQMQRLLKMLDEVSMVCRQLGYLSVLIDCREVRGHLSEPDRYLAGIRMAEKFGKIRLAALLGRDAAMTKFAERVAVAR